MSIMTIKIAIILLPYPYFPAINDYINGFKIPPEDSAAISEKIDFLIGNPDIYENISANGIKTSEKFNFLTFSNTLIKYLNGLQNS